MVNPDLIEKIKTSDCYMDVVEYLASMINELQTFEGLEGLSNTLAGEEVNARIKAAKKLRERLQPLIEKDYSKKFTDEDRKRAAKKYGLEKL